MSHRSWPLSFGIERRNTAKKLSTRDVEQERERISFFRPGDLAGLMAVLIHRLNADTSCDR